MNRNYVLRNSLLIRDAVAGDVDALADIMADHESSMARVAMVILGDGDAANDAVQNAWQRAWTGLAKLRNADRLRAWLLAITANEARQIGRAERRRRQREAQVELPEALDSATEPFLSERRLDLHAALRKLSDDDRELLALRFAGGLTSLEIAASRKATDSAIRGRLARVLARLRQEMGE